jgi:hypothetical protein
VINNPRVRSAIAADHAQDVQARLILLPRRFGITKLEVGGTFQKDSLPIGETR